MTEDAVTNPTELETPTPAEVTNDPADEPDQDAVSDENDDGTEQEPEAEFAEIERDGKIYKVPKELEKAFLQEADYTRKTQAAAEKERTLEAMRQEMEIEREIEREIQPDRQQLAVVESRLAQFHNVNWQGYFAQNPQEAQAAYGEYANLKDAKEALSQRLGEKQAEAADKRAQSHSATLVQAAQELQRPDPNYGWHGKFNDEAKAKLVNFATKELNWSEARISAVRTAQDIKELHLKMVGFEALKSQRKALTVKKEANPVPTLGTGKGKATTDPDRMSFKEWSKWDDDRQRKAAKR